MPLTINFTGLCAFRDQRQSKIDVVLPNLFTARNVHGHAVPAHSAYLTLPADNRITRLLISPEAPYSILHAGGVNLYVEIFNRHHLRLKQNTTSQATYTFDDSSIIHMDRIIAGPALDDSLLDDKFDPDEQRVAVRVLIEFGNISGMPNSGDDVLEFQPRLGQQTYRNRFAEIVRWQLASGIYEIGTITFGADIRTPIPRWRIDATGADEVLLEIGNTPITDIILPSPRPRDENLDYHFHAYYDLCRDTPAVHPLPHRVSASTELPVRVGGPNCPPAVFP